MLVMLGKKTIVRIHPTHFICKYITKYIYKCNVEYTNDLIANTDNIFISEKISTIEMNSHF